MNREFDYEQLSNMYTVYIESNLAKPLSGSVTIEISPQGTARDVVNSFLLALQREDGVPGLAVYDKHYDKLQWDTALESQGVEEGSKLYIGYDNQSLFRPFHLIVVGFTSVIIAAVLLVVASVLFGATGGSIPFDYGIVIDAGSTHTEVFLYQWSGDKQLGTGEVHQKDFCRNEDGIADVPDPETIVACVKNVTKSLPNDKPIAPILYLGATGGMRLLNISDSRDADLIIMTLKYALSTAPVIVNSIEIIQGKTEGVSSWITTNFLTETLQQHKVMDTYGALDLGGASTQYAFALNNVSVANYSDATTLRLYGHEYFIQSESFLCFGLSKAIDRNHATLFIAQRTAIVDPCLPKDYTKKKNVKLFFSNPCVQNEFFAQWLHDHPDKKVITITGTGNYEQCKQNVQDLVNEKSCSDLGFKQCLHKANITENNGKFMAFASFYYIVSYLHGTDSLEKFILETRRFCSLTWEQVKKKSHSKSELSHLATYCFGAVYVIELLTSNYGFDSLTWKNIIFKKQIKGSDVGWSLGYMINATNAIPEESPTPPVISLSVFIPLIILSIVMVFASLMLLYKTYKTFSMKHSRLSEFE